MTTKKMKRIVTFFVAVAMLVGTVSLFSCGKKSGKYVVLEDNFGAENYAVGFRKGDDALALKVQEILDEMIADGKAGEIAKKWFDSDVMLRNVDFPRELKASEDDTSLQYVLDKGELILGLDETFPPMGFRDEKGEIIGFDIDLATEVCSRLGVKLKLQPINWNSKEMELSGKTIDCIWNGMSVDDERTEKLDLSKPYIANNQIIIVSDESGIKTKADLAGKKIGAQTGSSSIGAMQADEATYASFASLDQYDSNDDAYLDLKAGRIDALVVDEVYGRYMIGNDQ